MCPPMLSTEHNRPPVRGLDPALIVWRVQGASEPKDRVVVRSLVCRGQLPGEGPSAGGEVGVGPQT
ncbi:hypothetical protein KI387_013885, partial [Taxus chinensis]